jgi:hypothetical protein
MNVALHPDLYDDAEMKDLMITFTFARPTTPSIDTLPAANFAIWVGPEFGYDHLIARVRDGHLRDRFKPLKVTPASVGDAIDMSFLYPDEVFQLSASPKPPGAPDK